MSQNTTLTTFTGQANHQSEYRFKESKIMFYLSKWATERDLQPSLIYYTLVDNIAGFSVFTFQAPESWKQCRASSYIYAFIMYFILSLFLLVREDFFKIRSLERLSLAETWKLHQFLCSNAKKKLEFPCTDTSQFIYPFYSWLTFELFPVWGDYG